MELQKEIQSLREELATINKEKELYFKQKEELKKELKELVVKEIGPIARPEDIEFRDKLPKTRSGKIMRRLLKAEALGKDVGDISTLED